MTYRYQLYKCPICGTVTEIVHDGVSAMICCGKTMEVLDDREPVGTKESHMPVVEATEKGCKVSVGSKLHGMDADHLLEWDFSPFDQVIGVHTVQLGAHAHFAAPFRGVHGGHVRRLGASG